MLNSGDRFVKQFLLIILLVLMPGKFAFAGWGDLLKDVFGGDSESSGSALSALSNSDMIDGLKEALSVSTKNAIQSLGKTDGFFANNKVKIRMPEKLQSIESGLRKIGQDKYADEFILTMNRAAEQAIPETANILGDAIKQMTFDDAKAIVNGPDNAATEYFRSTGGSRLFEKMLPIVQAATEKTGVTNNYKNMIDNLGFMKNLVDTEALDLDKYVTNKTMDGLFSILADEEKLIRTNPAARTTELLKKVFRQ